MDSSCLAISRSLKTGCKAHLWLWSCIEFALLWLTCLAILFGEENWTQRYLRGKSCVENCQNSATNSNESWLSGKSTEDFTGACCHLSSQLLATLIVKNGTDGIYLSDSFGVALIASYGACSKTPCGQPASISCRNPTALLDWIRIAAAIHRKDRQDRSWSSPSHRPQAYSW